MTIQQIKAIRAALTRAPSAWIDALAEELPKWGIDSNHEIASFLAQVAHESNEFTQLVENLNYSVERLLIIWPRRFPTIESAMPYARNPEKLANHVYCNRMGNGDEASGDGWRYRGRGPIQITGRHNYEQCGIWLGAHIADNPDLLLTPKYGIQSAIWFWKVNNLDDLDDDSDVKMETRRINGGVTGLEHRQKLFDFILNKLEAA